MTLAPSSKPSRNPELLARLERHMQARGLDKDKTRDRAIIGQELGYKDQTAVYRYLADKWSGGDLDKFETRLTAHLENEMRIEGGAQLIDDPHSFIQPSMFAFLNQVRACGDIGVAHGAGGIGKSCACRLYAAKHKATTIYLHLYTWTRRQGQIVERLLKLAGVKPGPGQCPDELLARRLRDDGIMLVIDNAQRMTKCGRDWLRDFLDMSGVPIALVGNPEIIGQWARCDQHKRVVGLKRDVSLDLFDPQKENNTSEHTVQLLLKRHLPEASSNAAVKKQALEIIRTPDSGAVGAVVMHAKLAKLMLQGGRVTDPAEAFRLATTQLIQEAA